MRDKVAIVPTYEEPTREIHRPPAGILASGEIVQTYERTAILPAAAFVSTYEEALNFLR